VKAYRLSAVARPDLPPYAPHVSLVFLLVLEMFGLSMAFDTQRLTDNPSSWAHVAGSSPQLVRLAIAMACVTVLFAIARQSAVVARLSSGELEPIRARYLGVHAVCLLLFVAISQVVVGVQPAFVNHPALWTLAWAGGGVSSLGAWALALGPVGSWLSLVRSQRASAIAGVVVGTLVWASGFATERLWVALARVTFAVVGWMLHLIYPVVRSDPSRMLIGTPHFAAVITPQCSGYEGIGLITVFLSVYLWLFRRELRFPGALLLLPIGAAVIWIANAMRIVALIAVGTAGWKAIAQGGFHSQAGWITFNAIALTFVALMVRGRYFAANASPRSRTVPAARRHDATTVFLAPFFALSATAMLTGALSSGFDWLYPVRLVVAAAVIWMFKRQYAALTWKWSWWPLAIGFAGFLVWLTLLPLVTPTPAANTTWPIALRSIPWYWAAAWLLARAIGYVVTAPLAEELAFRGFLARRLVRTDFDALPIGVFTWVSFVASSVIFGAFHGRLWLPGTIAGMLFALAIQRRGALGDGVQAHATTNGLLALYACLTGQWGLWS